MCMLAHAAAALLEQGGWLAVRTSMGMRRVAIHALNCNSRLCFFFTRCPPILWFESRAGGVAGSVVGGGVAADR
jgi:hypothetical protein